MLTKHLLGNEDGVFKIVARLEGGRVDAESAQQLAHRLGGFPLLVFSALVLGHCGAHQIAHG